MLPTSVNDLAAVSKVFLHTNLDPRAQMKRTLFPVLTAMVLIWSVMKHVQLIRNKFWCVRLLPTGILLLRRPRNFTKEKSSQNSMSPLDVRLLFARSASHSTLQPSHPPAFNYSNFPNLGEVDLDYFEATFTNSHAPFFSNIFKINKPKSPRKQLQTKAPTQSPY